MLVKKKLLHMSNSFVVTLDLSELGFTFLGGQHDYLCVIQCLWFNCLFGSHSELVIKL